MLVNSGVMFALVRFVCMRRIALHYLHKNVTIKDSIIMIYFYVLNGKYV